MTAANINQWGAGIPFGNARSTAATRNTYFDIPDSLVDVNGNGIADADDRRTRRTRRAADSASTATRRPAPPGMPWADGLPGCTNSEAWPTRPEIYNLMMTRRDPNQQLWVSREPDWMRNALGAGRSTTNTTTTMSFTLGLEGDLPSGDHHWDVSLYTGRSDNTVDQLGSMRLHSYRDVLAFPNFGSERDLRLEPVGVRRLRRERRRRAPRACRSRTIAR